MPELAKWFDKDVSTIERWALAHEDFRGSLLLGREPADDRVERSLYHRAMGYSHPAVQINVTKDGDVIETPYIKHYPPDTLAAIFWLKNRRRKSWTQTGQIDPEDAENKTVIMGGLPDDPE